MQIARDEGVLMNEKPPLSEDLGEVTGKRDPSLSQAIKLF